ncbi:MAG: chorismate mutase, partial [Prevotella sp.]
FEDMVVELLSRRMSICRDIVQYKKDHNMTVFQAGRYREILEKYGTKGGLCGLDPKFVAAIFESIHQESVRQQIDIVNH